jgi:hypothetical protein
MTKIKNIEHLEAEIERLRLLSKSQEQQLKKNLMEIREDLRPENILMNFISSLTGIRFEKKEFFKNGIAYALSFIIQRFVLKTEKKIEEKAYDFLDSLFEKIKSFMGKHTSHEAKREERKENKEESHGKPA